MAPTSLSWFYTSPGDNPYQISERVRLTLWDARVVDVWLDHATAAAPHRMPGVYRGRPIELEWMPAAWLRLNAQAGDDGLVNGLSNVLGMRPGLQYVDADDHTVWEWHIGDVSDRWREVSGNPAYLQPQKLK
ncbi:MAG: hypothetical protein ACE5FI_04795 [Anaerolineales bacterium]